MSHNIKFFFNILYIISISNSFKHKPANFKFKKISKFLERLILQRIQLHTSSCSNFNQFQSVYRRYYSAQSTLLQAFDIIYHSIDKDSSTLLMSLYLCAFVDRINHNILLYRLPTTFCITSFALAWF